jgi:hypothetical protein
MATTSPALSSERGKVVTVTIHVDSKGEVERVNPEPFAISKGRYQQVLWQASDPNAHFTVDFGDDSPFDYTQFSDAEPYSGLVRREVLGDPGKYYKYTVRAGGRTLDPGGVVNP